MIRGNGCECYTEPEPAPSRPLIEGDGQASQPADDKATFPLQVVRRQPQAREAAQQSRHGDTGLLTREQCAGTEVVATAEGEVGIGATSDVDRVGLLELGRVAVRGSQAGDHGLPALDRCTAKGDTPRGATARH